MPDASPPDAIPPDTRPPDASPRAKPNAIGPTVGLPDAGPTDAGQHAGGEPAKEEGFIGLAAAVLVTTLLALFLGLKRLLRGRRLKPESFKYIPRAGSSSTSVHAEGPLLAEGEVRLVPRWNRASAEIDLRLQKPSLLEDDHE